MNQPAQENAGLQKLLDSEDALAEPALLAFLDFIDGDIAANPGNISEMPTNILQQYAQELTKNIEIDLNEAMPDD